MKSLSNIENISHCWICNHKLVYDNFNRYYRSNCDGCDSFYLSIQDTELKLHIYDVNKFDSKNNLIDIIFELEYNNVIISFIYENIEIKSNYIYKNTITFEDFKKLDLKEFVFKIIKSYIDNLLFI
jgi:hypothetical protein